ncbi:unnamed protein product [Choristocarpus tenellus]
MPHDADNFLRQLFGSSALAAKVKLHGGSSIHSVQWERLSCTIVSMAFFDCLKSKADIVTETGYIRGCYEETINGLTTSDKLRELLANPESEHADVFTDPQKGELIYHLFKSLSLGGAMCQPDENLEKYKDVTKLIYKDLMSVFKNSSTGKVEVTSQAFRITGVNGVSSGLFKAESPYHTCLVVIDRTQRCVSVVWKEFVPFW